MSVRKIDREAEAAILGAVLLSDTVFRAVMEEGLRVEHFGSGQHQTIFAAMQSLVSRGDPVDTLTLKAELGARLHGLGGERAIDELAIAVPNIGNVRSYARRVLDVAYWRGINEAAQTLAQAADVEDRALVANAERLLIAPNEAKSAEVSLASEVFDYMAQTSSPGIAWPFRRLNELAGGMHPAETTMISGFTGLGKALDVSTPIPTPGGWRTMRDLQVGDHVFDETGQPTPIVAISPIQTNRPCREVVFLDGTTIITDEAHEWLTFTAAARQSLATSLSRTRDTPRSRSSDQRHKRIRESIVTTAEIAETLTVPTKNNRLNHSILLGGSLKYAYRELPIDPYVFGAWLGDGSSWTADITSHNDDAAFMEAQLQAAGENPHVKVTSNPGSVMIHFGSLTTCRRGHLGDRDRFGHCSECVSLTGKANRRGIPAQEYAPFTHFTAQERLRALGVLMNKHIPDVYLHASVEQRLALLQGLMDTDGYANQPYGGCEFTSVREVLATQVLELAIGLGIRASLGVGRATIDGRDCGPKYRVTWTSALPVFRMPRKVERLSEKTPVKTTFRSINDVRLVESRPVKCIQVAAESQLYLASRSCIPTHNSLITDTILQNAANHGHSVRLYINEGSRTQRALRAIARETGIAYGRLRRRTVNADERKKVLDILSRGFPFEIVQAAGWSADRIARDMRWHPVDLTAIDLIHEIGYRDERELASNWTVLKAAGVQNGTHLIAVAHLNEARATSEKPPPPVLRDIRGSGGLKNGSDNVLFIHRDHFVEDGRGVPELVGSLWFAKSRSAELGGMRVQMDPVRMRFVELARDYE